MRYELKLGDGRVVSWEGATGEAAAVRYADAHRDVTVVAWRAPRVQIVVGGPDGC